MGIMEVYVLKFEATVLAFVGKYERKIMVGGAMFPSSSETLSEQLLLT